MRKRISKILAILLLALPVLVNQAVPAKAAMIENGKYYMENPVAGGTGYFQFNGNTATGGTIEGIQLKYLKVPSGNAQNPTDMSWAGVAATVSGANISGLTGTWTIDKTTDAGTDKYYLHNSTGTALAADAAFMFKISGVTNPAIAAGNNGCNPSDLDSAGNSTAGTCFVDVSIFGDLNDATATAVSQMQAGTNLIDHVIVGFTVTTQVSMTATVDPTLQFTVAGINSGTDVTDAGAVTTTTETSTYSTLPFSYLTVGTPELMAHRLYVKTNAQNGYSVRVQGTTNTADEDGVLEGQYSGNNIDGFTGTAAGWGAGGPETWASPTSSTANAATGWVGVNSTDTDTIFTGGDAANWSPLENDTANEIMKASGPELGTLALSKIVSYAIEVDVYQPADTYSGTLRYTCTPTY